MYRTKPFLNPPQELTSGKSNALKLVSHSYCKEATLVYTFIQAIKMRLTEKIKFYFLSQC